MSATALAELRESWSACDRCDLHKKRHSIVFGEGNPEADILIIGEGPGETEDRTGKPFQGDAGNILADFLVGCKLDRDYDCFITNIVACRPTAIAVDERTGKKTVENRVPSKVERAACWPRVHRIIYEVDPLLIVAVGKVPLQMLTGKAAKMGKVRGRVQTMTLEGLHVDIRYPVMPIYHTAFLARNHDHRPEGPWGQTANDFLEICRIIDHLRAVYYGTETPVRLEGVEKRGRRK